MLGVPGSPRRGELGCGFHPPTPQKRVLPPAPGVPQPGPGKRCGSEGSDSKGKTALEGRLC